jgi:hypothetical protein
MEQHTLESVHSGQPHAGEASAEAIAKGYEPNDIGLRPVFMFIGGLVVVLVVVLAAIYAIMMALADADRSGDAVPSPIAVKLPAPYAPLQPSLGIYGNHENDHDVLDWQDMDAMRYKTTQELNSSCTTAAGRKHIAIAEAMDEALPLLKLQPVAIAPAVTVPVPAGSYEGVYNRERPTKPQGQYNDMNRLNNLGN